MEAFPRTEESVVARSWAVLPNVDYANARPVGVTKKLATAFNNGQGPLSSTTSHSPVLRGGNAPDRFDGNFFELPR
jgi:hypothetical protein